MSDEDDIRQVDIDLLFVLSHGELLHIPLASANRLMTWRLIQPVSMLDGASVIGMKRHNVGITRRGLCMVSAVRKRQEPRFIAPAL